MNEKIKIKIEYDPSCQEPELILRASSESALVERIAAAVTQCVEAERARITAWQGGSACLLNQRDIIRVYTDERRLVALTREGAYHLRCTLREVEALLDPAFFVRISRFELVNMDHASAFDFNMAGTVKVNFDDGSSTWVARRYVRSIQQMLDRAGGTKEGRA